MKNSLVEVKRGEVFTSSKIIAEMLSGSKDQHGTVLKTINKLLINAEFQSVTQPTVFTHKSGAIFKEDTFTNRQGRTYKMFNMNEQGYMFLTMQLGQYKNALEVQGLIIEAFMKMKQALMNKQNNSWIEKRESGKHIRLDMTDTLKELFSYIKETCPDSNYIKNPNLLYSNYSKMENKYLQLIVDSKDGKPLRDLATVTELGFIGVVDNRVEIAIKDGLNRELPYKEIYKFAKSEVEKLVDSLCFKKLE